MDDFKKLYDVLVREGKFTKSYDDFQSTWLEDEEYKDKVYDVVKRDGLFTKEKDSFLEKYSLTPQKKNPIEEEEPLESSVEEVSMDAMEEIGAGEEPSKEKSFEGLAAQRSSTGITGYPRYSPQDLGITFTDAFYNAATNQIPAQLKTTWSLNPKTLTVEDYTTAIEKAESEGLDYAEIEETNIPSSFGGAPPQPATRKIVKVPLDEAKERLAFYRKGAMEDLVDITMDRADASKFVNPNSKLSDGINPKEFMALIGGQLPVLGVSMAPVIGSGTMIYGDIYMENLTAIAAQKNKVEEQEVTPSMMMDIISKGEDEKAIALTGAAIATSLDVIGLGKAFNIIKGPTTGLIRNAVKKGIKEGGRAGAVKALRVAGNVLTTGSVEASTEALQGVTSQVSKQIALGRTASEAFSNIDSESLIEEGIAGFVMGGGMSTMHTPTFSSKEVDAMIEENDLGGLKEFTEGGLIDWKTIPNSTKSKLKLEEQNIGEKTYTYPTEILGKDTPKVDVDVKEDVDIEEQSNEQTTTNPTGVPSMDEGTEPNVDQVDAEAGLTAEESTNQQEDLIAELNAKRDIELEGANTKKAQKEINKKYDAELEALPTGDLISGLKGSTYLDEQSNEDFESLLGNPKFKIESKEKEEINSLETNPESIQEEMSKMPEAEINFKEPNVSQDGLEVNPIEESNSTTKISKEESDKLRKPIQYFNGMPMIHGMSDMMSAGVIMDSEGNPMSVEGGLLYNVLGKNKENAWAGVNYKGAQDQLDNAVKLYNNNKDLFDKLWADGKLPDGHVPMAIMRMGNTAVNSNEAVFRWISPAVKKLPKKNRTEAVNVLKGIIDNRLSVIGGLESLNTGQKAEVKTLSQIQKFIKKNKIKSLDQLIDAIPVDAKKRAKGNEDETLSLDTRGKLYTLLFSPEGTSTASKKPIIALYDGVKDADQSVFTSDVVYKAIGEPSVLRSKKGEVIGVVGIDVKNGEVNEVEHGNYGFGPKGKPIALISNPKHGIDVFPEWRAKASRIFKPTKPKDKTKEPSLPKEQAVADQVGGAFFTDKAFAGSRPAVGEMTDQDVLVGKLRYAFPSVTVAKTQLEFDNIIKSPNVRTKTSKGEVVLGLTLDGKIYLNPSSKSLNTPIHEFGHIWFDFLRSKESGRKGKQLLTKGLELVTGTTEHKKAMKMYGDTELAKEEALVELMASKGETLIGKAKKEFKSWMNGLFKYIKEKFVGTEDLRMVDIKDMSLEDFVNTGLSDLFKGKSVDKKNRDPEPDSEVSFKKSPSTESTEFKNWFGDSKVVEPNGDPSVMYHGTKEDFEEFDNDNGIFFTKDKYVAQMYSEDAIEAMNEGTETIVPVYLRIESPFDIRSLGLLSTRRKFVDYVKSISGDTEFNPEGRFERDLDDKVPVWEIITDYNGEFYSHLDKIGYDGIFIKDENDIKHESYIVWNANQAKHAAENNGNWSRNDDRMRFKKSEESQDTNTSEQPQVRFKKQAESTDLDDATQLRNLLVDNQDLIMNEVVFKKLQENGVSIARVNKFRALARNLIKTTLKLNERFESEGLNAEQQAKAITEDIKKYSKEVAPLRQFVLTMVKDDKIRQIFQDRDTIKQFYKKGKLGEKWQSVMFMMDPTKINPMTMPKALFDEYVEVINNIAKKLKRGQLYGTDIKMIHDFHENLFKNNEDAEIDYIAEAIAPFMMDYEAAKAKESSESVDDIFFKILDDKMGEESLGEDQKRSFKKNKKQILNIIKSKNAEESTKNLTVTILAKDRQQMWNVAADAIQEYEGLSLEEQSEGSAEDYVGGALVNSELDNQLIKQLDDADNLEYIFKKGKYHARRNKNIQALLSTIESIKSIEGDITENIFSKREKDYARTLLSIKGKDDLLNFEAHEINQITKTLQGVETGLWLPPIALRLHRKVESIREANKLEDTIDNSGIKPLLDAVGEYIPTFEREVIALIRNKTDIPKADFKKNLQEKLAGSYGIAQLGKMKNKYFENFMNKVYSAYANTEFILKKIRTERANIYNKISNKTRFGDKTYTREDMNILVYMKQLELMFLSNPTSKKVPKLSELVKDLTIVEGVKRDNKGDNQVYEESMAASFWKEFGNEDGSFDLKRVDELLAKSNADVFYDYINKLSEDNQYMVMHNIKYSQGKAAEILNNHATIRVRPKESKLQLNDENKAQQPISKSKTSIDRDNWKTNEGYRKEDISWDAYDISSLSSSDQIRDYHLNEEYKNVYAALTVLSKRLDRNGQAMITALQLDLAAKMTVANNRVEQVDNFSSSLIRNLKKSLLSSLGRIPAETMSNLVFAIKNPSVFNNAFIQKKNKISKKSTIKLLKEYPSAQIDRLMGTKYWSDQIDDVQENVVVRPKNFLEAFTQKLPGISNASSSIIGLSDKMVASQMWQANFAMKFKEIAGVSWNDNFVDSPALKAQYEGAIKEAMASSDVLLTKTWQGNGLYGTTVNMEGNGYVTSPESGLSNSLMNWFRTFRTGHSTLINESLSNILPEFKIRDKIYNRTQGAMTKSEAVGTLTSAYGSIFVYGLVGVAFREALVDSLMDQILGADDDDKSIEEELGKAMKNGLIESVLLSTRLGRMNSIAYGIISGLVRSGVQGLESDGTEGAYKEIKKFSRGSRMYESALGGYGALLRAVSDPVFAKDKGAINTVLNSTLLATRLAGVPFTRELKDIIDHAYPDVKPPKKSGKGIQKKISKKSIKKTK